MIEFFEGLDTSYENYDTQWHIVRLGDYIFKGLD